MSHCDFVIMCY